MNKNQYIEFLEILKVKYNFIFYCEYQKSSYNKLILRHDIDFDVELACQMAMIENELNVKSNYFFMLSSESYNVLNVENYNYINKIRDLGHKISLHYDPVPYKDYIKGLELEISLFESIFKEKIDTISFHRPNDYFLNYNKEINGIEHTYQDKYFKQIKYFSDSRGSWRYGSPVKSLEFKKGENLQILIHPVWWLIDGLNGNETLKNYFKFKKEKLKNHFSNNCIPFREIRNEIE